MQRGESTHSTAPPVLTVEDLKTYFDTDEGVVRAVDGISFELMPGKVLGVVGESGSGKTVASLSLLGLVGPAGKVTGGRIMLGDRDIVKMGQRQLEQMRGNDIAMVFQDPLTALNPVFTVGNQIIEAIRLHQDVSKDEARERAIGLLARVGIPAPSQRMDEYPHQLSGGMRQRAMIAMALSCRPRVLIADEPTTALDVTIQAQILALMDELRREFESAILLITHDLGVVAELADDMIVMYAGRVVEQGPVFEVFANSRHPYTWSLLRSLPRLDTRRSRLESIPGTPPSLINLPDGCRFAPRCRFARDICRQEYPSLAAVGEAHHSACHFAEEFDADVSTGAVCADE